MVMTGGRTTLIRELFHDLSTFGRLASKQAFRRHGDGRASHTRIGLLFVLHHDGQQNLKELADRFGMTSSAATQIVQELEKDHLVARRPDREDRRKLWVRITVRGKNYLAKIKRDRFRHLREILADLTDDELLMLRQIERKIVSRLQTLHQEGDRPVDKDK